ncbi:hypothetical protein A2971_00030 [Candidatus Gottesmanbacteria bacterium RIFCSPLOWO2_01_FULL_46_21]|uniref:Transglutaminase-like domain-containing protein n=1 Tax=Candidatus Gottesmanbacteria bacterium RIFCSPLOWO2_01_FULL_46_21 TaxID=1798393 RepID=A0A1F6AXR6_9BACT|nr:MAG: hypothetical protein A2971_00030 [Candidatus Gottesmanbacteria bacterium RIFCSPLOWO2_01_FULL_46_21]
MNVKYFVYLIIGLFVYLIIPRPVVAAGEFSADYEVAYAVAPTGTTIVTHQITLTNKLTNLYAREYSIVFDSTRIKNIIAYDNGGQISPEISQKEGKTEIKLHFNTQVVGVGKKLTFSLRFENDDVAQKLGSIWEVHIPGIASDADLSSYYTSLSVPTSFGPTAYMSPPPAEGKRWNLRQMTQGGVSVAYGNQQQFLLNLSYYIQNPSVTGSSVEIALPPDTAYQKVTIASLNPTPKEIVRDPDGNWLARYSLGPGQKEDVVARLYVALSVDPRPGWTDTVDIAAITRPQRYWESTDPTIIAAAKTLKTPQDIYRYVIDTLSYDYDRVNQTPIRKGARAALASPTQSICMEFTDLFIALSRAAGIPSREIVGYAYTTNTKLRPLSLVADVLHSWPEYYDNERQLWIPVDPTWADTTGGIDYFTKLDFNHITFAINGEKSDYPYAAGFYRRPDKSSRDVSVTFADIIPQSQEKPLDISIGFPGTVIAGFETKGNVTIGNHSTTSIQNVAISVQSTPVDVALYKTEELMPPFSTISLPVSLTIGQYFSGGTGRILVTAGDQQSRHEFTIRPTYWLLLPAGVIITVVGAVLLLFLKRPKPKS